MNEPECLEENQDFCEVMERIEEKLSVAMYESINVLKSVKGFYRKNHLLLDFNTLVENLFTFFEKIMTEVARNNLLKRQIEFDLNYEQTKLGTVINKTSEILRKSEFVIGVLFEFVKHSRMFPYRISSLINFNRVFKAEDDLEMANNKIIEIRKQCSFKKLEIMAGFALCVGKWLRVYRRNKKFRMKIRTTKKPV